MDLGLIVIFALVVLVVYITIIDFIGIFNPTPRRRRGTTRRAQNGHVIPDNLPEVRGRRENQPPDDI